MKSTAFGFTSRDDGPRVLQVDVPDPGEGQIRVRVELASFNGFDLAVVAGWVWDMLPTEFPVTLGRDFAGRVESVGPGVAGFAAGDLVCGVVSANPLHDGGFSELLTVDAGGTLHVPQGVSPEAAAALGLAAVTALDLVEALGVTADDVVLVSGATGGVGGYVVQLASQRGATVLATARDVEGRELVLGVGADHVVDYSGDLSAAVRAVAPSGVTAVVHAAGDAAEEGALLVPGGRLATLLGATAETVGRDDVTVIPVYAQTTAAKLQGLLEAVQAGSLRMPVIRSYPFDQAATALADFGGSTRGKVLLDLR
jgi:NADPH:quinone reductase